MGASTDLFAWWNAIYSVPLAIATVYLLVTTLLGLGHGGGHDVSADHGVETGHDLHLGHDLHAGHDVHVDHGGEAHHDAGHEQQGEHGGESDQRGGFPDLLLFLGAGKAPLTLVLEVLLITWGVFGLCYNEWLSRLIASPVSYVGPSAVLSLVSSLVSTRVAANLVARVMPKDESSALRRTDLVGLQARAIFAIDGERGAAMLTDRYGTLHQVACRADGASLAKGTEVVLVDYVPEHDYYLVAALPDDLDEASSPAARMTAPQTASDGQTVDLDRVRET